MMRKMNSKVSVFALLGLLASLAIALFAQSVDRVSLNDEDKTGKLVELTVGIANDKENVALGEDVRISVVLFNRTDHEISFISSYAARDYLIEVRDGSNQLLPLTENGIRLSARSAPVWRNRAQRLLPGASFETGISVTDLFRIDEPGKYSITVSRAITNDNGQSIRLNSKAMTINVN